MAPLLIKEVTRRVNVTGIWQAVYTAGVVLPKPVTVCRFVLLLSVLCRSQFLCLCPFALFNSSFFAVRLMHGVLGIGTGLLIQGS